MGVGSTGVTGVGVGDEGVSGGTGVSVGTRLVGPAGCVLVGAGASSVPSGSETEVGVAVAVVVTVAVAVAARVWFGSGVSVGTIVSEPSSGIPVP